MTATTPHAGLPYPETTVDKVRQGAANIKALAEALDTRVAERWCNLIGSTAQTGIGDNVPTVVGYASADSDASGWFDWNGGGLLTYHGPRKWYVVSFGANLAVNGTIHSSAIALEISGSTVVRPVASSRYAHLGACVPARLDPGNVLSVVAVTDDNTGNTGGAYDNAYLRVAGVA